MLDKQIEECSWRDDGDAAKLLEGLQMSLVAGDQIIDPGR